jgi:hypothetical protein
MPEFGAKPTFAGISLESELHLKVVRQCFEDPSKEIDWIVAHCLCESTEFYQVNTPVARLDDRNMRLLATDQGAELRLGKARLLTGCSKDFDKDPIGG